MECTTESLKMLENDSAIRLFNVVLGLPAIQALHVAHELNLFEIIGPSNALSLQELSDILHIQPRPLQALLSVCASFDLLKLSNIGCFALTEMAKNLLLKESPFYLGKSLDLNLRNADIYSFKSLKKALLENASQVYGGKELFQTNEEQAQLAKYFTHCMHGKSIGMAGLWPNKIDFSRNHCLLDIGGGSGAQSIGAVSRWPNLKAIVYDRPIVTDVAQEYIDHFGLTDRIQTQVGDMWTDPFPASDIHFYCDIFHDWSIEQCKFLAKKSYSSLKANGRIVIHEMLFNDDKTGPSSVASYNIMMLIWTQSGQQLSKKEMVSILANSGFVNIKVIPTGLGDWSLVEGQKL